MKLAVTNSPEEQPHKYRILVIDDDKACAQLLTWAIESLEQAAQIANDGPTAIELAKTLQPEVIFLDITLPGMTGYEICAALRSEPGLKNTIIVAQSGWGQKEHKERTKAAGFDYHLVKPVSIDDIKNIFSVLEEARV